jgi:hypothetical protein
MNFCRKQPTFVVSKRRADAARGMRDWLPRGLCLCGCLGAVVFSGVTMASTFYKCTDASGKVLFTNTKPQGKQDRCTTLSYYSPPPAMATGDSRGKARAVGAATPADFPRVANDEQKSRDNERRAILERELNTEQSNLEKARQLLASSPPANAQAQRDTVALHERNIKALQKELDKLR